jgi:hypothetical protein
MGTVSRISFGCLVGFALLVITIVVCLPGWSVWEFAPLVSAFIGGGFTLFAAFTPGRDGEEVEPWLGNERIAWVLIGCGVIMWGCGECIWRYYSLIGQTTFPSNADVGYASFPPFIFLGLLLFPSSGIGSRRILLLLDSLITMGSMLAIGWYLLLGSLVLASMQNVLAKSLGLYYPTSDIALLSCVILLFFRGQGSLYQATARRISLIVAGIGLCFFACSDFVFNVHQNAGIYVDGTWRDLGWPLGMLSIGAAAHLRRFLPVTPGDMIERRLRRYAINSVGLAQLIVYSVLGVLCTVLLLNVFASSASQLAIRPTLIVATICVIALVVVRQILTIYENENLTRRQTNALERLEIANKRIEEQARMIAERNAELEEGIDHLKDVQARIANGNLRARARLTSGALLPLAASLNLMVERLMYLEQSHDYAQRLNRAIQDLIVALEKSRGGNNTFIVPASCRPFPEIGRLLYILGLKEKSEYSLPTPGVVPHSTPIHFMPKLGSIPQSLFGNQQSSQSLPPVSVQSAEDIAASKTTDSLSQERARTQFSGPFYLPQWEKKTDETEKL